VLVSYVFELGLLLKLLISSIRCVGQLTLMAVILKPVFEDNNIIELLALSLVMIIFGTIEISLLKIRLYYKGLFPIVFTSLVVTNFALALFGTAVIMRIVPFYQAQHFIPTFGMLLGNSINSISLSLNNLVDHFQNDKDKIDFSLAFGATKWEAVKPFMIKSIRIGMLPTLNAMAVQGIVTIPGMMTGQILAGTPVMDAVKYQHIIMFLIGAASTFSTVLCSMITFTILFDGSHRLKIENLKEPWFKRLKKKIKFL
jgi:uncharacterized protein (TIGR00245 family)